MSKLCSTTSKTHRIGGVKNVDEVSSFFHGSGFPSWHTRFSEQWLRMNESPLFDTFFLIFFYQLYVPTIPWKAHTWCVHVMKENLTYKRERIPPPNDYVSHETSWSKFLILSKNLMETTERFSHYAWKGRQNKTSHLLKNILWWIIFISHVIHNYYVYFWPFANVL